MKNVTIIGQGNVATHLCIALAGRVDELINISSRELEDIPSDSDIYILAVSDNAIAEVAARMPKVDGIVAHTAGSVSMQVLMPYFSNVGVFYPLQTFTKGATIDYSHIPCFIEGSDSGVEGRLLGLASLFTSNLHKADSDTRQKLHLASVFACNFTNYLWSISQEILSTQGYGMEVLMPLIEVSISKLKYLSPADAQTGPARRGDTEVVNQHLQELNGTHYQKIYELLSEEIMQKYNSKGL